MTRDQDATRVLDPQQRRLFELLRRKTGASESEEDRGIRAKQGAAPLTLAQEQLWRIHQMNPQSSAYNVFAGLRLWGPVQLEQLERALDRVLERHGALRTRIYAVDNEARQELVPFEPLLIPRVDLSMLSVEEREAHLRSLCAFEAGRLFDLDAGRLLRATLVELGDRDHALLLCTHHIVSDAWSMGVLMREIMAFYGGPTESSLPEPPELEIQFADYARWERKRLTGERLDALVDHWRSALQDSPPLLDLPGDRPRPARQTFRGRRYSFALPDRLVTQLDAWARERDVSRFTVLLTVFKTLLFRYTGETRITVGSPVVNRRHRKLEPLIAFLVNVLPLHTRLDPDAAFLDNLARVREAVQGGFAHQDVPFELLVDRLGQRRDPSYNPVFQCSFALVNSPFPATPQEGELRVEVMDLHNDTAKFDLTLDLWAGDAGGIGASIEYSTDLFDAARIERMADHYVALLEGALADPSSSLHALPLLSGAERRVLVEEQADRDYDLDRTVHGLFAEQAAARPQEVAVVDDVGQLSYRELDERSDRLARVLRSRGAGPGTLVGIHCERSLELVVSLLAVLKSGAAYLPLDPSFPTRRLAFMLEDARVSLLLSQSRLAPELPEHEAQVMLLDRPWPDTEAKANGEAGPSDLAYVIYTSGSTGHPQGVQVEHRNVVNFLLAMDEVLDHPDPGVWLAVTSISFDISVLELFWSLTRGFRVILRPEMELSEAANPVAASTPRPELAASDRPIDFGLFYFASEPDQPSADCYRVMIKGGRFADRNGFSAVWTPERHFDEFGGLYPNPALTSAALAMVTRRVQLRAGSVVAPLHHPVRLAENWAVVDNLSNGRVELSFASGWHADDFVFAPDSYDRRKEVMADTIESVRRLWRGEELTWKGGRGQDVAVRLRPRPVQPEPRFWMTSAGNVETFREAGRLGFCVLTHLLGQRPADLALKIAEYRQSFAGAGHDPQNARVALMLHTYIGESIEDVVATVREPFCGYLRQSLGLMARLMQVLQPDTETVDASPDDIAAMIHHGFERYMGECGLLGTPQDCALKVLELQALGVDEIACLADFGVEEDKLFASLERLVAMRRDLEGMRRRARTTVAEQIRQYGVTHLQCTPSLMRMLLDDPAMTEALPKLHALLLGGEALPPSLVQALAPNMPVRLINMYGPTETTIWSSYADVLPSEPITIGRPLANNRLYVLDAQRAPVPVGVPGELYIGGAGVVRGYLKRPQLTAQRFLVDTMSGHPGARMYKTGDRVRRLPNGRLEFLGRLDHQIKIRGHRVELGEIESLLARVPGILEAVVHPWPGPQGDVRLAAYLVMDRERLLGDGATDAGSERIDRWRAVWDQTYADPAPDPAFDITGWRSSYDGRPIASEQMHEWVDEAGLKILAEEPTSCLEIGCGSGLLLYRIAPHCTRYRAVDFSQRAVAAIAGRLDEAGLADIVEVRQREAADLVGEPARAYDVVVLNSVAQYFPDGEYLLRILPRVEELVADGGRIFLGDLRSLELLDAFHASVAAAQEGDGIDPLRSRFLRTVEQEEELLVSPAFFGTLDRHLERLRGVRLVLKAGNYDNEMNRFRYDAVLHIGPPQDPAGPLPESLHARGASIEPDRLREALASDPAALVLRDLADPRTSPWVRLAKTLRDPQATDLPAATGSGRQEIEALVRLAEELGYRHEARVSASGLPDTRDVLLWDPQRAEGPLFTGVPRHQTQVDASFFNDPLRGKLQREYAALVNQELGAQLPKYMLPSSCTVLSAFPMTPNGKVDRKALPEPNRASHATRDYSPPSTPIERLLVELWESVLGMNMVGIHDDFFDLGGDSLTATQVVHLVRKELDSDLPFHVMFDAPTIAQLAVQLEAR